MGLASNVYVAVELVCSGWAKCTRKPASSLVRVWLVHALSAVAIEFSCNEYYCLSYTGRKHWVVSAYLKVGNDSTYVQFSIHVQVQTIYTSGEGDGVFTTQ